MVSSPAVPSLSERSVEEKKEKDLPKQRQSKSSVVHGMQKVPLAILLARAQLNTYQALSTGYADSISRLLFGGGSPEKKEGDKVKMLFFRFLLFDLLFYIGCRGANQG